MDTKGSSLGRRRALHLLGGLGLVLAAGRPLAAAPVGTAVSIEGPVALERQSQRHALLRDDPLMLDDAVRTSENGFAALLLANKTRINLGANSHIKIEQFIIDQGGVMSIGGSMLFDRPSDLAPLDLQFLSAFGRIGVRGTRFFAGPSKGKFAVFVDRGKVSVAAAGVERILIAGEGVEFAAEGAPPGTVVLWGEARIAAAFELVRVAR